MFEFKGEISKECKKYIHLRKAKIAAFIMSISSIIVLIPTILICIYLFEHHVFTIIVATCLGFVFSVTMAFFVTYFGEETQREFVPIRVFISEDGTIIQYTQRSEHTSSINEVKRVIDYGAWVVLVCPSPTGFGTREVVCQKNLLVKGTLDDFDDLLKTRKTR